MLEAVVYELGKAVVAIGLVGALIVVVRSRSDVMQRLRIPAAMIGIGLIVPIIANWILPVLIGANIIQ